MAKKTSVQKLEIQHPYIECKAGVCGGEPVIKDTRISVRLIIGWDQLGKSVDEIIAMYPHLTHAQVYDALSYYYDHREQIDQLIIEKSEEAMRNKYKGAPWMS